MRDERARVIEKCIYLFIRAPIDINSFSLLVHECFVVRTAVAFACLCVCVFIYNLHDTRFGCVRARMRASAAHVSAFGRIAGLYNFTRKHVRTHTRARAQHKACARNANKLKLFKWKCLVLWVQIRNMHTHTRDARTAAAHYTRENAMSIYKFAVCACARARANVAILKTIRCA